MSIKHPIKHGPSFAPSLALTLMLVLVAAAPWTAPTAAAQGEPARAPGQAPAARPFGFRTGQSIYIVAFRRTQRVVGTDPNSMSVITGGEEYTDIELDAEREIRKRIEEWRFFAVAERPSDADFVFLVNIDGAAMEGLVVPSGAYRAHFKEQFDLDALRDAAHGRYLAGPLKLPTLGRLSERLVKQFRERVGPGRASAR
ncbi:MAG TPA: hypothetical protein VEY09_15605 [Pyrinomonadaceae bacterium]|nr:hypothetical protein [Pyrinomonadaceae bacterium]